MGTKSTDKDAQNSVRRSVCGLMDVEKTEKTQSARTPPLLAQLTTGRNVCFLTITHGERMDTPFPTWLRFAYRGGGERYKPYDMNMPQIIPRRPREHYQWDPPLSVHGKVCAGLIGLGMHDSKKMPYVIYSSPELRCVETASGMIDRLNAPHVSIRIEPALAEWPMLSSQNLPKYWLTPNQHMELGHPIDLSYRPLLSVKDFPHEETPKQYMQRLADFYMFARKSTNDEMLVIVTNPSALLLVKGHKVSTGCAILSAHEETRPLFMHALHIESNRQVHKDPLLIPLTPTVTQVRESRNRKEFASDNKALH